MAQPYLALRPAGNRLDSHNVVAGSKNPTVLTVGVSTENITQENSHMTICSEKDEQPKIQICCEDTSIGEYPVMIVYGLHYEHDMVITYDILRTRYIAQVNLYHYAYINTSKGSDTTQVVFDETDLENYKDLVGYGSNYMLVLGNKVNNSRLKSRA